MCWDAPEEMLQVHRGDALARLLLLMVLVFTTNISKFDRSFTPEPVHGWHMLLLQNYQNGRGLNIDRRK